MRPDKVPNLRFRYDYDFLVCFQYKRCSTPHGRLFGHVFLFRNVNAYSSIRINPTVGGIQIVPYTCNVNDIRESLEADFNCYVYRVKHEDYLRWNVMVGCTCVSMVKNILGIRKWWIQTPRQLERWISGR